VVPQDADAPPTLEQINAHLRAHKVATQKLPERLEVVPQFPLTATGKIQKHQLRADIAAKLA
jgi:cyclohexanecarboxylate-CoA ligase